LVTDSPEPWIQDQVSCSAVFWKIARELSNTRKDFCHLDPRLCNHVLVLPTTIWSTPPSNLLVAPTFLLITPFEMYLTTNYFRPVFSFKIVFFLLSKNFILLSWSFFCIPGNFFFCIPGNFFQVLVTKLQKPLHATLYWDFVFISCFYTSCKLKFCGMIDAIVQ
jgi:hypothetical protein